MMTVSTARRSEKRKLVRNMGSAKICEYHLKP